MSSNKRGKVLYDFTSQADNQINLKAGQILTIVSLGAKGGWSKAIDANGKISLVFKLQVYL